ncbi:glutamate receptor ionotropic, delta-2-like [Scylla paramamosain]|uniref:glutamate receptor ionotropic, delta-2-like n=1 Tax=Scylla paramamosain TaxID=85552 RepID=UPI003083EAF2
MRVLLEVVVVLPSCLQWTTSASLHPKRQEWSVVGAVESVLTSHAPCQHACLLLADQHEELEVTQAPRGVRVLQAVGGSVNGSDTRHGRLRETVDGVRELGEVWQCLVVVVVSDDPAFLAAFAHLSLRRHALRWSTRILVLTRLPLSHLGGLHGLLSNRNAMLLRIQDHKTSRSVRRVGVFVWQPYSAPGSTPLRVATWTPHGRLTLASHMSLFPDKFSVFSSAPRLKVVVEVLPAHSLSWVDDAGEPGGRRLEYTGYISDVVKYFAARMNFTTTYVLSPERTFGSRMPDGSWTGMIGMVVREEADFSPGPFVFSHVRYESVDYTYAFFYTSVQILSGLSGLETDPWGFLLPLTLLVWAVTLAALLGVLLVLLQFPSCLPGKPLLRGSWSANTFSPVRILLQQDVEWPAEWWWWERLVLGLWMLTVLVLGKSYSGNLMSLLAVRYVPQPFQTLRDVLDHPSVVMIWQKYSGYEQLVRDATFGEIREVAGLEKEGRLEFHTQARYKESLDTLVRTGGHVLVDAGNSLKKLVASDFSNKGRCDFYLSRDGFFPSSFGMVSQKTNPLVHGFNKRTLELSEQGLFDYGMENVPNFTECGNIPKKALVMSSISVSNIWGVFVLLGGGLSAALVVWCMELTCRR